MTDGKKKGKASPPRNQEMQVLNWLPVLQEMDYGDARAAALVATSLLENNLTMAIISRLRPLSDDQQKELFDKDTSPIATFHAKILLGFALNLFDERVLADLRAIKHIRNKFAHHIDVRSFDHAEVSGLCDKLNGPKFEAWSSIHQEETDRRKRFLNTAAHLTARFDLERKTHCRPAGPAAGSYECAPDRAWNGKAG